MTLTPGAKLGPYEITSALGAGGMGEVYRARDPRIGRDVAIKVLPTAFSQDPERLRRFEQEARSAGKINHPNILAIYDIGTHDGAPYLVSELLEGETLRDRLKVGAIPPRKAIEIGAQIAHGLAAAHEHGIIHRDLKPENLFITKDGRVKILDFGLAKLTAPEREGAGKTDARTLPADSGPGVVWGTVGYMSPEQVRGNPVDHRSDIFAFGAILYEMVAGKRAFYGATPADTMSAILKDDPPDLTEAAEGIPPALERIARHCLEKGAGERFQSARDLAFNLEAISGLSGSKPLPALSAPAGGNRPLLLGAAALAAIVLVAGALWIPRLLAPRSDLGPMRVTLESPVNSKSEGILGQMSVSPDGRRFAFAVVDTSGKPRLWMRAVDQPTAQPIAGTEEGFLPFWSPDGKNLGFFAKGKLRRIPAAGGPVQDLCDAPDPRGGSWGKDGIIVFAPSSIGGLFRVSADGGQPAPATTLDPTRKESAHRWPCFLPDGRHFLYAALPGVGGEFDNFVGAIDSKDRRTLFGSSRAAVFAEPGYLLYSQNDLLMAKRFDPGRLKATGEPVALAVVPVTTGSVAMPAVTVSRNGVVAYVNVRLGDTYLKWLDLSGNALSTVPAPQGRYEDVKVSPDGQRAALVRRESASNRDIWILELGSGAATRFTFDPGNETGPVWSPDSRRIAFISDRDGGVSNIYMKSIDGGDATILYRSAAQWKNPEFFSPDGKFLLFDETDPKTQIDLWLLPLSGDRTPIPYLRTQFTETSGAISPDGHWVAYDSDESGRQEVYVQSFPTAGAKRQISTAGGNGAFWLPGGKGILYTNFVGGSVKITRVDVSENATAFQVGATRVAAELSLAKLQSLVGGAYAPDGQRLLAAEQKGEAMPPVPTLIVNWPELVKEKK